MSQRKQELEAFREEAMKVRAMTESEGWQIVSRDISTYLKDVERAWPSMDGDSRNFKRLQVQVLACRKLIEMVEDYDHNRILAEREWLKEEFPDLYVQADVDNQTPLKEKEG